jgi:hypothetical protein
MTLEERKAIACPRLEKARKVGQTPENIAKRNAAVRAAWTEEKRAAWAIKMRPQLIEQNRVRSLAAQARKAA